MQLQIQPLHPLSASAAQSTKQYPPFTMYNTNLPEPQNSTGCREPSETRCGGNIPPYECNKKNTTQRQVPLNPKWCVVAPPPHWDVSCTNTPAHTLPRSMRNCRPTACTVRTIVVSQNKGPINKIRKKKPSQLPPSCRKVCKVFRTTTNPRFVYVVMFGPCNNPLSKRRLADVSFVKAKRWNKVKRAMREEKCF